MSRWQPGSLSIHYSLFEHTVTEHRKFPAQLLRQARVEIACNNTITFCHLGKNPTPGIDNQRMAIGGSTVAVLAELTGCNHIGEIFDRAGPEQGMPVCVSRHQCKMLPEPTVRLRPSQPAFDTVPENVNRNRLKGPRTRQVYLEPRARRLASCWPTPCTVHRDQAGRRRINESCGNNSAYSRSRPRPASRHSSVPGSDDLRGNAPGNDP